MSGVKGMKWKKKTNESVKVNSYIDIETYNNLETWKGDLSFSNAIAKIIKLFFKKNGNHEKNNY